MNLPHLFRLQKQIMTFGVVGGLAFAVHFTTVFLLVNYFFLSPLIANIGGFCCAFSISYFGHRQFTFASRGKHRILLPRLLLVGIGSFIVNEILYYLLLNLFHWHYLVALLINLSLLTGATFIINKYWVFRPKFQDKFKP